MAKKKDAWTESTETSEAAKVVSDAAPKTDKHKGKRGRPKGSKNAGKAAPKKTKGKRGRPKGSKNKPQSLVSAGKRPRGRPRGSGKKPGMSPSGLRGIIVEIVREEVHAALLQAFKGI